MPKTIHRPEYDALRKLLRDTRTGAGVTQTSLSEALGRSQSFVSDVERGVRRLDVIELRDVCHILGSDFLDFMKSFEKGLATAASGRHSRRPAGKRRPQR